MRVLTDIRLYDISFVETPLHPSWTVELVEDD